MMKDHSFCFSCFLSKEILILSTIRCVREIIVQDIRAGTTGAHKNMMPIETAYNAACISSVPV
jgi:hypothetical protein